MNLKQTIHKLSLQRISEKQTYLLQLIADAREASISDAKSSMGDKYETTREMMQAEIEKLTLQLQESRQQLLALKVIDPEKMHHAAENGALVHTNLGIFYIAAGLGKLETGKHTVMVISPTSPLFKSMHKLKKGDSFLLNQIRYTIESVE